MTATTIQPSDNTSQIAEQPHARMGLALVRLTIGAMFVWVFFENLGKGLYTPSGYAGLIQDYIDNGHAPAVWKSVMAFAAAHAWMAAPLQGFTEISLGVLLLLGLFTRPVALVAFAFLASLWVSEWGTAWIWELLIVIFRLSLMATSDDSLSADIERNAPCPPVVNVLLQAVSSECVARTQLDSLPRQHAVRAPQCATTVLSRGKSAIRRAASFEWNQNRHVKYERHDIH